jgi:decaprenylphospho-beta-D-ribofuranose 2-oxidase
VPGLLEVLDQLDEEVAAAGGRLYLAKDSRQSAPIFKRSHPKLNDWIKAQERIDIRSSFLSDMLSRLNEEQD